MVTATHSINTLLIANRGEIACRIMRTAQAMGIRTVAVFSDEDAQAQHVSMADEAVRIGPAPANESYLNIDAILQAAKLTGTDAVHPGYGFLSENPEFVEACDAAGIVFIGPRADAIRAMGLKDAAKALMEQAGVPVVPGYHGDAQDEATLARHADIVGYPVLIKARAGGGGKGMRLVGQPEDFSATLDSARREAASSFGDDHVLIEKFISNPRHIEIQVFGDNHGDVVHLFERDCSLQRRHQKVLEESPAPGMSEAMREAMTTAAVTAARAIDYRSAGTIEFIVDGSSTLRPDRFWFMEMNTRLQVEHPVTEAVSGVDLVEWQLRIAAGEALPKTQTELCLSGHAVEARLYAEDVPAGFLPATGVLHRLRFGSPGRVDSGVVEGDEVSPWYDPMLAKLIVHGKTRDDAFRQLRRMLASSVVMGTVTNRDFLEALCGHPRVVAGDINTGLIESEFSQLTSTDPALKSGALAVAALALSTSVTGDMPVVVDGVISVARSLGNWEIWGSATRPVVLLHDTDVVMFGVSRDSPDQWTVSWQDQAVAIQLADVSALANGVQVDINGRDVVAEVLAEGNFLHVRINSHVHSFERPVVGIGEDEAASQSSLIAPMPGRVTGVFCNPGARVTAGKLLLTLEAMKMEHSLTAPADAEIESVFVSEQDQVQQGEVLLQFKAD